MLARSKLNSIETLTSRALIGYDISHEEYQVIINEEEKYRKMKEDIRMMKSEKIDAEKVEINEEKGRKVETNKNNRENNGNAWNLKIYILLLSKYKIFEISAKTYEKNGIHTIKVYNEKISLEYG